MESYGCGLRQHEHAPMILARFCQMHLLLYAIPTWQRPIRPIPVCNQTLQYVYRG